MAPDTKPTLDVLRGTLDVLILKALSWGPQHGYTVTRWIRERTDQAMLIEEGALYPALYRLEAQELIEGSWGTSENNRRARFYKLTPAGAGDCAPTPPPGTAMPPPSAASSAHRLAPNR